MTTTATLSMRAGVAFLWSEPLLRPLFGIVMIFVGIVGANGSVIMPALFVDAGRQVAELGLFSSMMGAGGLLGIAIHASVGARISAQNWLAVAFCGSAVGSLLLSQLPGGVKTIRWHHCCRAITSLPSKAAGIAITLW